VASRRAAKRIRVFGSVGRGSDGGESDVNFLVVLEPGRSLFDLGGLQSDLEVLLQRSVDVVTETGLRPRIRNQVLREAKPL
jgi:predicted nucleotidyltransferase